MLYFNQIHDAFARIQYLQLQALREDIKTHPMAAKACVLFTVAVLFSAFIYLITVFTAYLFLCGGQYNTHFKRFFFVQV